MLGELLLSIPHSRPLVACALLITRLQENFRRRGVITKARLTYMKDKMLQLKLQTKEEGTWKTCFQVKASLPSNPYIGFSALTGDVSDNHE